MFAASCLEEKRKYWIKLLVINNYVIFMNIYITILKFQKKNKIKDTFYLISFNYSATLCYKFQNIEYFFINIPWQLSKFRI